MKRIFLIATLAASLAACGETAEERDQRQDRTCQHYGAKPGTTDYIQCRATIHVAEVAKQRADDAAMMAQGTANAALGASMMNAGRR